MAPLLILLGGPLMAVALGWLGVQGLRGPAPALGVTGHFSLGHPSRPGLYY